MSRLNILNYQGFIKHEDRKERFTHGCDHIVFEGVLDLSEPIRMRLWAGFQEGVSLETYTKDVMSFMSWWKDSVWKDLNGFGGFHNVKFEFDGFTIINSKRDDNN